jgi:hypothetical protein
VRGLSLGVPLIIIPGVKGLRGRAVELTQFKLESLPGRVIFQPIFGFGKEREVLAEEGGIAPCWALDIARLLEVEVELGCLRPLSTVHVKLVTKNDREFVDVDGFNALCRDDTRDGVNDTSIQLGGG